MPEGSSQIGRDLAVHRDDFRPGALVHLAGTIDETVDAEKLGRALEGAAVIDLDGVRLITSFGVRTWVNALRSLRSEYYCFVRCRPTVVSQFNMVAAFPGQGHLVSFYLPYACPSCGKQIETLVDLRTAHEPLSALAVPAEQCPDCHAAAEFDDVPDTYLSFAASRPKPAPPPQISLIVDGSPEAASAPQPLRVRTDLALAGAVQTLYLPRVRDHRLGALGARGFYRPAAKCGGDWWWFEQISQDVAWVLVGDVTGHGAASAMVTASAATGFQFSRRLAPGRSLPETLTALHEGLRELCRGELLMTMSALEIDAGKGEVRSFNAGGMPAFALRPGGRLQSLAKSGNPLGCAELVLGRDALQLEPGERLLLYTDGLPELKTAKRPLLGAKRLAQLFTATAGLPLPEAVDALVRGLDDERKDIPQGDDVTFVMLEWSGPSA